MSRRTSVALLALVQTATLVAGATTALAHPQDHRRAPAAQSEPEPWLRQADPVVHVVAAKAVAKPKPKAKPVVKPRTRTRVVRHTATVRHRTLRHHRTTSSLTPQQRMMRAVARIPGYHSGDAVWAISSEWGHWGVADLYGGVAYISPTVPADRMYDVVAHEWSHLLMVEAYGGDVMSAMAAANSYFGGSDLTGSERAADCMARVLGATWTHYTSCTDAHWRAGARRLVDRQRL